MVVLFDHHGKRNAKPVGLGSSGRLIAERVGTTIQAHLIPGETLTPPPKAPPLTFQDFADQ